MNSGHHDVKMLQKLRGRFLPKWRQFQYFGKLLSPKERAALKFSFLVLIAGIAWISYNFLSNYRVVVPAVGGRYVEAVVGAPQFVNPIFSSTNDVDMDIVRLVYSGLMRYEKKGRLVPDLAVKYDVSADKKIYTFYLHKDVLWHDGESFTSRDVIFTMEAIQNTSVGSPLNVAFQAVKVEALDDYTVRFTLPEPFVAFLSSLTVGILPEHVWFNIEPEKMRLAQSNWQPVGAGPFMFKKMSKDSAGRIYTYDLVRFDRYYRQPPFLQDFVFQFYSDYDGEGGAIQAVRTQEADGLSFVPPYLKNKVERKHINLVTLQLPQYTALFFNQDQSPFLKDKKVRLALSHAIDKDRLAHDVLKGSGEVINSPILSDFPGYDPAAGKVTFSFAEANKLLDTIWPRISSDDFRKLKRDLMLKDWEKVSATSTPSADSLREQAMQEMDKQLEIEFSTGQTFYRKNKESQILEINLVTVDTEEYRKSAEIIAGLWQEIGVKTNIKLVATRSIVKDVLKSRAYDVLLYGEIIGSDPDPYPFWHSSQIDYPGLNLSRYVNRNADGFIERARVALKEEDSADLYKKFQELLLADCPAVFLYAPTYTYAISDKIQGREVLRISQPSDRFVDITDWYMKTKKEWRF